MPPLANRSLEGRIDELEQAVRSLQSGNLASRASVVNADGSYVALSALAFGQATSTDNALVELYGVANTVGGTGWIVGSPSVDVLVTGGRLRVDVAASMSASGNKCSTFMSWALLGPGAVAGDNLAAVAATPEYFRSIEVQHSGTGMDQRASIGTFALHTGLAPGWYRVSSRYALSYSGTSIAPYGSLTNRRLSAAPY